MNILVITSLLLSTLGLVQQTQKSDTIPYLTKDTIRVEGYCIRQYNKKDIQILQRNESKKQISSRITHYYIPIDYGPTIKYYFTTHLDGWETLNAHRIRNFVNNESYENIEFYVFPPVSHIAMERLPELAGCQDTVIFPSLSFYKLVGDKEHLYSIYRVSGVAERYCLKTTHVFEESVFLGAETQFWPKLTARVPYIYLYYFRWPNEATIETSVALDGFTIYWRRE